MIRRDYVEKFGKKKPGDPMPKYNSKAVREPKRKAPVRTHPDPS